MAIFTSAERCFEVTAISFSPAVIAFGEETSYSITVKNVSGKKISSMYAGFRLYFKDASGVVRGGIYEYMYGGPSYAMQAISWASGTSRTFTGKIRAYGSYDVSRETRLIPIFRGSDAGYTSHADEPLGLMLDFTTNVDFPFGGNSDQFFNLRGTDSEYLKVFDSRYGPTIPKFNAERSTGSTPDDEGENLLAGMKLALADWTHANRMRLQLRYRNKALGGEYAGIDLSLYMQAALAGETIAVVTETFDKNSDWELVLWYGDEYESAAAALVLSRAFANVHLSGASTGGVCFGSFSKATEGNPLFQCYYPAEFPGGIRGVTDYETGEVDTGGRWIDGRRIFRRVLEISVATTNSRVDYVATLPEVSTLIDLRASLTRTAAPERRYPASFWYSDSNYHFVWMEYPDSLSVKTSHAISGHVIIEYTKNGEEVG